MEKVRYIGGNLVSSYLEEAPMKSRSVSLLLTVSMVIDIDEEGLDYSKLEEDDSCFLCPLDPDEQNFKGIRKALLKQDVKVKSGAFENMVYGVIVDVRPDNTEPTRDKRKERND